MAVERWAPRVALSEQEQAIAGQLKRVRKLLPFLRRHRHKLLDAAFQTELAAMYRDTGAGKEPVNPALMAMATLIQGYLGVSDATMVQLTVLDLSVQMVLDCLGSTKPAFSQGAFADFRARFIRYDMDRRLIERTVELAQTSKEFDWRKLPKTLRVAVDSSPFEGAGRVEDTVNLLGHAARKVVACAASLLGWPEERVCREAQIPVLLESSVKKALDADWNDPQQKSDALNTLVSQLASLENWLGRKLPEEVKQQPLRATLATVDQVRQQDLEPVPKGGGQLRIREGVAEDRRVSIEDPEMRHGRKSKSKRFDGYKRHIAGELGHDLILAAAITPANRPEEEAAPELEADIKRQGFEIGELNIDRAYINSSLVDDVLSRRGEVISKPWRSRNGRLFPKTAFKINLRDRTITCPADHTQHFQLGSVVEFDAEVCDRCPLRAKCTTAENGTGRTVSIAENEPLQQRLRKLVSTRDGRERLRRRVAIEHRLAHLSRRQGRRARYFGVRKNTFDVRRAAAILNLETLYRRCVAVESAKAA
jgi:hypothetical protein